MKMKRLVYVFSILFVLQLKALAVDLYKEVIPFCSSIKGELTVIEGNSLVLKKAQEMKASSSGFLEEFLTKMLNNIDHYSDSTICKSVLFFDDIDGDKTIDTLVVTTYVVGNDVLLKLEWHKNDALIWDEQISNPYLWLGNDDIISDDSLNIWARITIGLDYAIPGIYSPNDEMFKLISKNMILKTANNYFVKNNLEYVEEDFSSYIDNYKGKILKFGHPEQPGLYIWYQPLMSFIKFYTP